MFSQKKFGLPESLIKSVAEAIKTHTVPKTEKDKKLAALAEPKDKITHKDVMVGRGVIAKEEAVFESHFKVGDEVVCKASGMEGEVVKVDKEQKGKYYTVKREDGKTVKYAPDELKAEKEEEDKDEKEDMKEAKDTGASKKKEEKFHMNLDKLVHKTFGHSPAEKKEKMKEEVEQIDEVGNTSAGQKMLINYRDKASKDIQKINTRISTGKFKKGETADDASRKNANRLKGWFQADSRIKEEVEELDESYRQLAMKGIGAEGKGDITVGRGVDYYHPKDGSKHTGKIKSMSTTHYTVKDDKTGDEHKFKYYQKEEVESLDEALTYNPVKTTHENPLVTVHDKDGLHTHANLSVVNKVFNTKIKHTDVHKGPVTVTSGREDKNKLKVAISKHHAKAVEDDKKFTKQFGEEAESLDEISLKKAIGAHAERMARAASAENRFDREDHYDKAKQSRSYIGKKYGNEGLGKSFDATVKRLRKEETEINEAPVDGVAAGSMEGDKHLCATKVMHREWKEGKPLFSQHAEPAKDGTIAWYDVMFEHGIEKKVPTSELEILVSESHMNHKKKK